MPDFFDRLLARSVPEAGAPAAGTVRVRPRLPGPFERIEAVRAEPPLPEEPAPRPATAVRTAEAVREVVRREREVVTDRHTVVRAPAEPAAPREEPARPVPAPTGLRPAAPLLRAAVELTPQRRDGLSGAMGGRTERRTAPEPAAARPRPSAATPVSAAARPAAAAAARPRAVDAAAARHAAKSGIGRRQQPAERVVHVQIGRLEVSAAAPPDSRNATAPARPSGRRAPALALEAFLSREETRS